MPKGKGTKPRDVARRFRPTFLTDADGRFPVVRGLKYQNACYISELGGEANLSHMERTLVKRIVHLSYLVELKEAVLIGGGALDVNEYITAVNCLSGLLSKIGLKRRAKLLPSLKDYLNANTKPEPVKEAPSPAPSGHNKEDA
jgi:hypothetical protein